jgi:outer membrane protein OmpA-like peptidoglycan-associated protein/tetratricopeptide (TPR) repeat protein
MTHNLSLKDYMLRRILILMLFGWVTISAFSQKDHDASSLPYKTKLELADRYFSESLFYSAAQLYADCMSIKETDRYPVFWHAMALYYARDYEGALLSFEKFYGMKPEPKDKKADWDLGDKTIFKTGKLFYGMTLHRLADYQNAKDVLQEFTSTYTDRDAKEVARVLEMAKITMKSCEEAPKIPVAKAEVEFLPTTINKPYTEAAPFLFKEGELYYSSTGSDSLMFFRGYKNQPKTYLYKSTLQGEKWKEGAKIEGAINEDGYHTTNGTFNKARSRFYFTRCLEMDDDRPLCNLFVAECSNGQFSNIRRLPENINTKEVFSATQPAVRSGVNEFNEFVYYVADRPGGVGGTDIWCTERMENGDYTKPKPININTTADEVTPFFDDSLKVLYFSSNGYPGFGGFDIFSTQGNRDDAYSFDKVTNIGKPLNSGADDLYYTVARDLRHGFFVTNRKGSVPLNDIATASDDIVGWYSYKYSVIGKVKINDTLLADLPGAKILLYEKDSRGKFKLVGKDSIHSDGGYAFKLSPDKDYQLVAEVPGFEPIKENISTKPFPKDAIIKQDFLLNKTELVVWGYTFDENTGNRDIFGATVSVYEVTQEGKEELVTEIELNRRENKYATVLPRGKEYRIIAYKEGYLAGSKNVSTKNVPLNIDSIQADIGLKKVKLNYAYRLNNILYDYAKADLREISKRVLDTLYMIMTDNPTMVIQLSSHTDSIGSYSDNMLLSIARAKSCVDYLVQKGIDKQRLSSTGYGEFKPIAPNSNPDGSDNPEGRALNRRTEFRILKL